MRSQTKVWGLLSLIVFLSSACYGAAITGTVKGADGAPFQGAFVEAQNAKTKINVIVLSDAQGHYRIPDLGTGDYRVQIKAVGFRADPRNAVTLTSGQDASFDFTLQKGEVRWNEISQYQGRRLFPPARGKDLIFSQCNICHQFQSRMASVTRDAEGWRDRVAFMREGMHFSAAPDKDGYLWIPDFGVANKITRLDPKTGEMRDFPVPNIGTAAVHSAVPALDGSVWLAEQGSNKIGRWDPITERVTEYQDQYLPGKEGIEDGGSKHTIRLDPSGKVWTSGVPLTRFDPETGKFTRFREGEYAYDVKPDKNGDVWFTDPRTNEIGKVEGKTMKVSLWSSPTADSYPRRMELGPDGMIYSGEYAGGKMLQFNPKTQTFKEFPLPGPDPSPYALGFDADGYLWYDSHNMDIIGRFDPKTGKVIEYPVPHSELAMREFFRDSQGRMWYGSAPNNKVGYFYLAGKNGAAASASK